MFKNAIAYRVTPGFRFVADLLGRRPARECGATESRTDGFVAPCDHSTAVLVHHVAGHQLICWQTEDKLLPGSVVAEEVAARVEKIEQDQERKVGRRELREIKEQVVLDLLPRAFVQKRRTMAALAGGYFIIDTSSQARADDFLSAIRHTLDAAPFSLIRTKTDPSRAAAGWMVGEPPELLSIDMEAVLEQPSELKPLVHYSRINLEDGDVTRRIEAGYMPKKIGLTFDNKVAFILTHNMQFCRLRWLDLLAQAEREAEAEDTAELFDIDMTICVGDIVWMLDYLVEALGGEAEKDGDLLAGAAKNFDDKAREDGGTVTISDGSGNVLASFGDGPDPLYEQAKQIVVSENRASISLVQRHLRIGYNRAAKLVEQMEKDGVVSARDSQGERQVVVPA